MDETGAFSLTEDFSGYTLDPAVDLSAEQWMALADAMGRYADGRGLSPLLVKTGGDDGTVTFEQLEPGLYLFLFGEGVHPEYDHIRVGFKTTLMSMPYRGYVTWNEDGPIVLPNGSASLYLVKQVRDEAHRFAITYHRELRGRAMTASILDEVPGLGPKRKKLLLKHFGSFKKLREAGLEQLEVVPGIPVAVARNVHEVIRDFEAERAQGDVDPV